MQFQTAAHFVRTKPYSNLYVGVCLCVAEQFDKVINLHVACTQRYTYISSRRGLPSIARWRIHQGRTTLSSTTARSSMRTVRKSVNSAEDEVFAACSVARGSCVHHRTMSDEKQVHRVHIRWSLGSLPPQEPGFRP
ncbi:unnamed protein product [Ectocarpus sp. 13 AM-2016]